MAISAKSAAEEAAGDSEESFPPASDWMREQVKPAFDYACRVVVESDGWPMEHSAMAMRTLLANAFIAGQQYESRTSENGDFQLAGHLRYARGLLRKAKRSGASFVDINADVLRYLVENRRKLNDRIRWAEARSGASPRSPVTPPACGATKNMGELGVAECQRPNGHAGAHVSGDLGWDASPLDRVSRPGQIKDEKEKDDHAR